MHEAHTSSEFDELLRRARLLLSRMGARVERQLQDAIECLASGSTLLIGQVMRHEIEINELERSVDELAGRIIARRKPTAGDLRLVLAFIKCTTDLERIADEAKKIALCAGRIAADRWASRPRHTELVLMARTAVELLHQAVGALDELDASRVADAAAREAQLDASLRGVLRSLISYMVEDTRTISTSLDLLFVAKSFERIVDHATNIFEHVIYAVHGENTRHAAPFSSQ
ncbi:MAG TPA: phosphate signaling complex protein PhoU [Burkholderiales bacterium]|jgi:phosphate transport system protein